MKLTARNEALLKAAIEGQNKEGAIEEISRKIEAIEKGMRSQITTGYTDVITRCLSLEDLKARLEKIVQSSREVRKEAENQVLHYTTIGEERESIQGLDERLIEVRRRFGEMQEYLEAAIFLDDTLDNNSVSDKIFYITQELAKMRKLKGSFKQYSFYKTISTIYKTRFEKFSAHLREGAESWIKSVDLSQAGQDIEFRRGCSIFNPIAKYCKQLLPPYFYDLMYGSRVLGIEKSVGSGIETELKKRIKALENNAEKGGVVTIISLLVLDKVLQREFVGFAFLREDILDLLEVTEVKSMTEVAWFRGGISALQINSEKVEAFIEKTVFQAFDGTLRETPNFFSKVKKVVQESTQYLEAYGMLGDDIEDMLIQRVDRALAVHVEEFEGSNKEYDEIQKEVKDVLRMLTERLPSAAGNKYEVMAVIEKRNEEIVSEEYAKVTERIKKAKNVREILDAVLGLKKTMTIECSTKVARKIADNAKDTMTGRDKEDYDLLMSTLYKNYEIERN